MQKLFTSFLKGILILAPMMVTVWVIFTIFTKIDGLLGIPIPGLGFVITIVFIILVGALASNIFFSRLFTYMEKVVTRLPVVKLLYFSIKDLIGAFVGEKKMFNRPVMVGAGASSPGPGKSGFRSRPGHQAARLRHLGHFGVPAGGGGSRGRVHAPVLQHGRIYDAGAQGAHHPSGLGGKRQAPGLHRLRRSGPRQRLRVSS